MNKINLDMYFYMSATGDSYAQQTLYSEFLKLSKAAINSTLSESSLVRFRNEDYTDLLGEIYTDIINNFDKNIANFRTYSNFLVKRRLIHYLINYLEKRCKSDLSLDDYDEEGKPYIDSIEDKEQLSISDQIALVSLKQALISVKKKGGRIDRVRAKVNGCFIQGYDQKEILDKLNISLGTLRYAQIKNRKDKTITNFKLDLK